MHFAFALFYTFSAFKLFFYFKKYKNFFVVLNNAIASSPIVDKRAMCGK